MDSDVGKMGAPTVLVDSNAIVERDWFLDRTPWKLLLALSEAQQVRLVVPEVVVREVIGKFRSTVKKAATGLRKLEIEFFPDDETTKYEHFLRQRLAQSKAEVARPSRS